MPDPRDSPDPADPLDRPSLKAALVLLVPGAVCAGLFYLWLGKVGESLVYGGMLGCGAAAMTVEFIKYFRSHRQHPSADGGTAGSAAWGLARSAFRVGFVKTFSEILREIFKLAGLKLVVTVVIAVIAFFVARGSHLI